MSSPSSPSSPPPPPTNWHTVFCYVFAAFNLSYAALSIFAVDWFCENVLFGRAPPSGHEWRYFTAGAGLVCVGISALALLLIRAPSELALRHCKFQIVNWIAWCAWEAHWLSVGASKPLVGAAQMAACVSTLLLSIQAWKFCDEAVEEENENEETLRGVLAGERRNRA